MTGEQFYRAHRGSAIDFGIDSDPRTWDELTVFEKAEWEQLAFENDLRDRGRFDMLRRQGKEY